MAAEPNSRVIVDRVEWPHLVLFPRIARAFTLASRPSRLLTALALLAVLMVTGTLWDLVSGPSIAPDHPLYALTAGETLGIFATTVRAIAADIDALAVSLLGLDAPAFAKALTHLCVGLPFVLFDTHPWFLIVFGLWTLGLVLAVGTMLARSVACEFALDQVIEWPEAMAYALRRLPSVLLAVAYPTAAVVAGVAVLAVGGLLFRLPVGDVVAALLYGPALLGGFVATALIILTVGGIWLIPPAVAVESCDAPDALSRAYAYVKNKPLRLLGYMALAIVVGLLGYIAYSGIAVLTMRFTAAGTAILGPEWMEEGIEEPVWLDPEHPMLALIARRSPTPATAEPRPLPSTPPVSDLPPGEDLPPPTITNGGGHPVDATTDGAGAAANADEGPGLTRQAALAIIGFWHTLLRGIVAAYVISYVIAASTVIYFLVRKLTDDQDLNEIWLPGIIEGTIAPGRGFARP